MKICFILNDMALSGGTGVVMEHAHQLAARHGFDVTVATLSDSTAPWAHRRLPHLNLVTVDEAHNDRYDVVVATWWKTCYRMFQISAHRYAYFIQSFEDRFYDPPGSERMLAAATHGLPVSFITEARWIAETLAEIRPDAPCHLVRNGISKDVFDSPEPPKPRTRRPLHVLLEGHPDVWFKGIAESAEALAEMHEPHVVTYVSGNGRDASPPTRADRVIGPLSQAELAREYGEADVLLKMSKVEGMYGPPLEAFHMGATCVTTPVTGHEEYIEHGVNALIVDWDDPRGTARALDLLARDRGLLHELRTNAWLTARGWPSWQQSSAFMALALRAVASSGPPNPYPAAERMLHDMLAGASELRRADTRLRGDLGSAVHEAQRYRQELFVKGDELAELVRSDAFRMGSQLAAHSGNPIFRASRRTLRVLRRRVLARLRSR